MSPEQRASRIRLVVLDVDGVLTDGRLYYGADGESMKVFDVRDGHGVKMLLARGIEVAILSSRSSPIVTQRARELGIRHVTQGQKDKAAGLRDLLTETGIAADQTAFVGDDLPDLPVLTRVGFAATVQDARDEVKAVVHWVAPQPGGRAAVRAVAEFILHAKGIDLAEMVHG